MTMTASWNNVSFGPGSHSLLTSYSSAMPSSAANGSGVSACRCSFCVPAPCSCADCLRTGGGYPRYHGHQHSAQHHNQSSQLTPPHSSPSGFATPASPSQNNNTLPSMPFYSANMPSWTSPGVLPFMPQVNNQPQDQCSSDEALSPPHQDDPFEDMMDVKEASRLQQEIVKAWKQKKRSSCEMKTRTHDKYRQVYSAQQRFELEKEFHYQRYISSARKSELSRVLQLSERQIKIWFQNRRAKERRSKKNAQKQNSVDDDEADSPKMSQFVKIKESPVGSPLGGVENS